MAKNLGEILVDDMELEEFGLKLLCTASSKNLKPMLLAKKSKPPAEKCKKILELWVKTTDQSECRWEQVINVLHDMNLKGLASQMTEALKDSGSRDDQLHYASSTSIQPSEASCRSEFHIEVNCFDLLIKQLMINYILIIDLYFAEIKCTNIYN